MGKHRRNLKVRVWQRDGLECRYCGKQLLMPPAGEPCHDARFATVDHIMPKALGGKTAIGNLLTACSACNGAKAARHPIEFRISVSIA